MASHDPAVYLLHIRDCSLFSVSGTRSRFCWMLTQRRPGRKEAAFYRLCVSNLVLKPSRPKARY